MGGLAWGRAGVRALGTPQTEIEECPVAQNRYAKTPIERVDGVVQRYRVVVGEGIDCIAAPPLPAANAVQAGGTGLEELYVRLEAGRAGRPADLEQSIRDYDDTLSALGALPAEATVRVGDLQVTDLHVWGVDDVISQREAFDLVRLNKAQARAAQAEALMAAEEAAGVARLSAFGSGPLGSAVATGTYEPNTLPWLLQRAGGIGGSDKIGYLDENNEFVPYEYGRLRSMLDSKTPEAVEQMKATARTGPLPSGAVDASPLPIKIGNTMERTIQYEFAVAHPEYLHLEDKSSRVAVGREHHRFNPDGVLQERETGRFGIFEAKTARNWDTFASALPGYKAQCLHNAAAADLDFAELVADIEGYGQFSLRLDFSAEERAEYRRALDRVWFWIKPEHERRRGQFR